MADESLPTKRISELTQTEKLTQKDVLPLSVNNDRDSGVFETKSVTFGTLKDAVVGETADNVDLLNSLVSHVPNQLSALAEVFAGVRSDDNFFFPFMLRNGRGCFIDMDGKLQMNAASTDIPARSFIECEAFELPDGAICSQIIVDPQGRVKEAWTTDGGYYILTPNGLKNVAGNAKVAAKNITYASAKASVTGMSPTRLSVNPDPRICYIIVTGGQSLAQGWNTLPGDVLIATDPLYPDACFMFKSSRGAGKENPNRGSAPITDLESLRETINGNWKESAASSLAAHIVHEVEKHTGHRIRTLSYIAATGGKPYMELIRGTPAWDALVQGLIDARDICEREGWIPVVLGLDWMAGESDMDQVAYMTKEREKRQLMQLDRDFNAEVKRIFPDHAGDAIISVCQSAFTPNGTWNQHVRQAQYESDGIGNIRLAGPVYPFPSGDTIHINSLGQNRRGQMVARVFIWEKFGTGWRTIKCTGYIWLSDTKIRLPFDTPRELVLDVSGGIISPDGLGAGLGFVCDDRTSSPPTVIDAVVSSTSSIDLTLSKPFANRSGRIGYAIKRNDGNNNQDGPLVGARGCLRDSTAHESLYETGISHPNWCPAFIIEIA
ncbi:hypothetical protein [Serratia marcescens]|uniref:hypothetical protein n=1 Tax=Serratia marcescens TaxID=615 RepID=UPI002178817D|nr:hypothetical protein [Serratia marcescens]CAI2140587.1 Uncharacterised protein [Serratia marcescens]